MLGAETPVAVQLSTYNQPAELPCALVISMQSVIPVLPRSRLSNVNDDKRTPLARFIFKVWLGTIGVSVSGGNDWPTSYGREYAAPASGHMGFASVVFTTIINAATNPTTTAERDINPTRAPPTRIIFGIGILIAVNSFKYGNPNRGKRADGILIVLGPILIRI
jgi:hypothetical protein